MASTGRFLKMTIWCIVVSIVRFVTRATGSSVMATGCFVTIRCSVAMSTGCSVTPRRVDGSGIAVRVCICTVNMLYNHIALNGRDRY